MDSATPGIEGSFDIIPFFKKVKGSYKQGIAGWGIVMLAADSEPVKEPGQLGRNLLRNVLNPFFECLTPPFCDKSWGIAKDSRDEGIPVTCRYQKVYSSLCLPRFQKKRSCAALGHAYLFGR
jgi:hypothetical protein